jgi:ubiquinone/menaquinone biosynthesis C-methylase UbiE
MSTHRHFIPALGADWLTPFYDIVARLMGERRFKRRLVQLAQIAAGHEVLDLGCGTGTLLLLAHEMCPQARLTGLDIDERILEIARRKITAAGAAIQLQQGSATAPPFAPASFDRILSTLMLHHLTTPQKRETLGAVQRLLRPGGEFHVADWGKPHNPLMRIASISFRLADGGETTLPHLRGELPALIREAGFSDVEETERSMTPFGTLAFIRARKSAAAK